MSDPIEGKGVRQRELSGLSVVIVVSDPWEFVSEVGNEVFTGAVRGVEALAGKEGRAILIQLAEPITFGGTEYEFLVATPRYHEQILEQLLAGEEVACGITGISSDKANSTEAFDLTKWRGGLGLIATIQMVKKERTSRSP